MTISANDSGSEAVDASPASTGALFPAVSGRGKGYDRAEVDAFLRKTRAAFENVGAESVSSEEIRSIAFPLVRRGYEIDAVDTALSRIEDAFAARERDQAVSSLGAEEWVGRARTEAQEILDRLSRPEKHRFDRVGLLRYGYRLDEVDFVADKLRRYLETGESADVSQVRGVAFRMQRGGYRERQVDVLLDAVVRVMLAVG